MSWVLLLGRILFGGFFVASGFNHFANVGKMAGYAAAHGVPFPQAAIVLSGLLLLLGGLSVLLGLAPRIGLVLLLVFLVPVTLTMHAFWADADPQQRLSDLTNFLKNTALAGAALGWLALPLPWALSLDALIHRRQPRWERRTGFAPPPAAPQH